VANFKLFRLLKDIISALQLKFLTPPLAPAVTSPSTTGRHNVPIPDAAFEHHRKLIAEWMESGEMPMHLANRTFMTEVLPSQRGEGGMQLCEHLNLKVYGCVPADACAVATSQKWQPSNMPFEHATTDVNSFYGVLLK
jgi:hypothetical protein